MVLMLGASGWASFTLYERTTRAGAAADAPADPRVEQLVTEGYQHLAVEELELARDKLNRAAGLAGQDPRVQEGLVLVAVQSAERAWLAHRLEGEGGEGRKRLEELDHAVHAAREVIATARREVGDPLAVERINLAEQRLNTLLVLAFMRAGHDDRARGVLGARLSRHPQRALLERFVGGGGDPGPAASATASPSASPSSSTPGPTVPKPGPGPGWNQPYEPHYEFDREPKMGTQPKTPGELQLPPPAPPPPPDGE